MRTSPHVPLSIRQGSRTYNAAEKDGPVEGEEAELRARDASAGREIEDQIK